MWNTFWIAFNFLFCINFLQDSSTEVDDKPKPVTAAQRQKEREEKRRKKKEKALERMKKKEKKGTNISFLNRTKNLVW